MCVCVHVCVHVCVCVHDDAVEKWRKEQKGPCQTELLDCMRLYRGTHSEAQYRRLARLYMVLIPRPQYSSPAEKRGVTHH